MAIDPVRCIWCKNEAEMGSLIGFNTNQCPHCGNPVMKTIFKDLPPGAPFCCENGGKWAKKSDDEAFCVESDSGYQIGEVAGFSSSSVVYPF